MFCNHCGKWLSKSSFYRHRRDYGLCMEKDKQVSSAVMEPPLCLEEHLDSDNIDNDVGGKLTETTINQCTHRLYA